MRGQTVDKPIMTIDTNPRYAISVAHIMKNYAGGYTGSGSAATDPLDTVTAKDHNSLVTTHIVTLRNHMDGQTVDNPLTTAATGTPATVTAVIGTKPTFPMVVLIPLNLKFTCSTSHLLGLTGIG